MDTIKEFESLTIDFPLRIDDTPFGKRCELLSAVQQSLMMYFVKAYKGKRREEKLLNGMFLLNKMFQGEEDFQEKILEIRDKEIKSYTALPQEILRGVSDIEDVFFGEYSKETYALLKGWFFEEREKLRVQIIR